VHQRTRRLLRAGRLNEDRLFQLMQDALRSSEERAVSDRVMQDSLVLMMSKQAEMLERVKRG